MVMMGGLYAVTLPTLGLLVRVVYLSGALG
jgi:hypothetical protein